MSFHQILFLNQTAGKKAWEIARKHGKIHGFGFLQERDGEVVIGVQYVIGTMNNEINNLECEGFRFKGEERSRAFLCC